MRDFIKRFWASVVSIGGVVALYIGADEAGLLRAFWITVAAAFVVALIGLLGPRIFDDIVKLRNYPALLENAAKMQEEIRALKASEAQSRKIAETSRREGIDEGRKQVRGAILAMKVVPPQVVAIGELDGKIAFVGESGDQLVPVGARFVVRVPHTGQVRGVVEVRSQEGSAIYMSCVEPLVPRFWTMLAERVSIDSAPPNDIELVPYDFSPLASMGIITSSERDESPEED